MSSKARLGDILLEAGEIDAAQLEAALREQEESGRPLGITLVRMGALREETLVRTLASQLSLPMASLEGKRISAEVLELVPFDLAEKHRCFPLFVKDEGEGRALYLGMEDASDLDAIDRIGRSVGLTIRPVLVAPSELEEALLRQYQARASAGPAPLPASRPPRRGNGSAEQARPLPPRDPDLAGNGLPDDRGESDADDLSGAEFAFDAAGLQARDAPEAAGAAVDPDDSERSAEPDVEIEVDFDGESPSEEEIEVGIDGESPSEEEIEVGIDGESPSEEEIEVDFDGESPSSGEIEVGFDAGSSSGKIEIGFGAGASSEEIEIGFGSGAAASDTDEWKIAGESDAEIGDTAPDLEVGPPRERASRAESHARARSRGAAAASDREDLLGDSLGEFGPALELDPPGREPAAQPDPGAGARGSEPAREAQGVRAPGRPPARAPRQPAPSEAVSRDAILRALTQLLVEKGVIEREELIARVHRESGGTGGE
jgi:hypothetical protein